MSVWFCIPSKRPPEEADPLLKKWRDRGYKVCLRRLEADYPHPRECDLLVIKKHYPGWAEGTNDAVQAAMRHDPSANWFVAGGDDYEPDPSIDPRQIGAECESYFAIRWWARFGSPDQPVPYELRTNTFGVMQPTGDRWGSNGDPTYGAALLDRIAGSPWLGREWCQVANEGRGPLWPEYQHMFADEELQNVAMMLDVFWQRNDIIQTHKHWGRTFTNGQEDAKIENCPEWLKWTTSPEHWRESRQLFERRKRERFPGHGIA